MVGRFGEFFGSFFHVFEQAVPGDPISGICVLPVTQAFENRLCEEAVPITFK